MTLRTLIFLIILSLSGSSLFSQQYFFRRYSVEEGLPQSSVFCILHDSRGFIWAGTEGGGLSRFDGVSFNHYTKSEGLTDNVVRSLFEDSRGNIYIGTLNGLTIYDGDRFIEVGEEQGLTGPSVLKIFEDRKGLIWAATNEGGLYALKVRDTIEIRNFSMANGLVSNFIFDICEMNDNCLWLAMIGGVNIIEFAPGDSLFITDVRRLEFDPQVVLSLEPGPDGTVLIGTHGDGLFRAIPENDGKSYRVEPSGINSLFKGLTVWNILSHPGGETWLATDKNGIIRLQGDSVTGNFHRGNGLPSNQILDLTTDEEGNTWFASFDQGIIMYDDNKFLSYGREEGIAGNQVLSVLFDNDRHLLLSTEEGFARYKADGERIERQRSYTIRDGLNDAGVNTMTWYEGSLWLGTNNGINILEGDRVRSFHLNIKLPDQKINDLYADSRNYLWIGTGGGYCRYSGGKMVTLTQSDGLINNEIQTIIEDSSGKIWMGTMGGLVRLADTIYTDYDSEEGLSFTRINSLAEGPDGDIWIGTFGGGLFRLDSERDSLPVTIVADRSALSSNIINSLLFINDSTLLAGTDKGFDLIGIGKELKVESVVSYNYRDGFSGKENNANSIGLDSNGFVWLGTKNGLVRFDPSADHDSEYSPPAFINNLKLFYEDVDWETKGYLKNRWSGLPEDLVLHYRDNHLTFEYSGLFFTNPDDLLFSCCLERNQSGEWSPFSTDRSSQFPGLTPGHYSFRVKARSKYGVEGEMASYDFRIRPPFWQTKVFIVSAVVALVILVYFLIKYREKQLLRENVKLENTVRERTRQVVEQKDEIERQRDILTNQKNEITDSIRAAETIQKAVLPEETTLEKYFEGYFVLFRPRDIVSGDFYWISEKDHTIVFTAADCTGHGVPGALMSMLGISFLRKIVNESGITRPADILNNLRDNIILSLKQKDAPGTVRDGMDIALCTIDLKKMVLQYAGANNPLILIRKTPEGNTIIERKADKMPVAFHSRMESFTNHEIEIQKGDTIYLFSDGFCDQFGGPEGRKFMKHQLLKVLLENQDLIMKTQGEKINRILEDWINYPAEGIGSIGQIDDIILMGVRI